MGDGMMPRSWVARLAALLRASWRAESGMVTVEMGLVLLILMMLAIGAYDFGRSGIRRAVLISAVGAGAQYGMQTQATGVDLDKIVAAVREEAGDKDGVMDISARNYCKCPGGGAEVDCTTTCPDGKLAPRYLEITAADEIQFLFDYPGLEQSFPVTVMNVTRVR